MDLNSAKSMFASSAVMTVIDPKTGLALKDAEGAETKIKVRSVDADAYQEHKRRVLNARLERQNRSGRNSPSQTVEQIENDATELLVGAVESWENVKRNGDPLPCTPDNIREVLRVAWLAEQIDAFAAKRANFSAA